MTRRHIIYWAMVGLLLIIPGCGGGGVEGGSEEAPAEATITINPSSLSYAGGDALTTTASAFVQQFIIVAKDPAGIPLRNVDLTIFYPFASPGGNVVQFYDGDPSQDAPAQDSPMSVTTDENGSYTLFITFLANGGLEYSADIQVSSGAVYGSATFEVTVSE